MLCRWCQFPMRIGLWGVSRLPSEAPSVNSAGRNQSIPNGELNRVRVSVLDDELAVKIRMVAVVCTVEPEPIL
jgi:hypothetical protein